MLFSIFVAFVCTPFKSANVLFDMGWQTLYPLVQRRLYLYTRISRKAIFLLFCSSSQSLCTPTSLLFEDSYPMSTDDCNDIQVPCGLGSSPLCKGTAQIFYSAIWWSVRLGSGQKNQRKCRQWQEAYKSSHWHQLHGIGSTSSSGPPIDLWKTNLYKLNLNRSLATIYFSRLHSCCKLGLKEGFLIP